MKTVCYEVSVDVRRCGREPKRLGQVWDFCGRSSVQDNRRTRLNRDPCNKWEKKNVNHVTESYGLGLSFTSQRIWIQLISQALWGVAGIFFYYFIEQESETRGNFKQYQKHLISYKAALPACPKLRLLHKGGYEFECQLKSVTGSSPLSRLFFFCMHAN